MAGSNVMATINQDGSSAVAHSTEPRPLAITPMQMLQIAVEQGADLDKLQKLMDLQERWEAGEARKAFVAALAEFKADPPTVRKNKHVSFGREGKGGAEYDHATLDNVVGAITPALSRHGLSHRWETDQIEGGTIRVTCVLTHVLGHSERVTLQASPDQSGSKNNIQAIGSTVSYLQRYTLLSATGLATADMDNDGGAPVAYITEKQAMDLETAAEDVKANKKAFLQYVGAATFAAIPASMYQESVAALERKRAPK